MELPNSSKCKFPEKNIQKQLIPLSLHLKCFFFTLLLKNSSIYNTQYLYISFYELYSRLTRFCEISFFSPCSWVHTLSCIFVSWFCHFLVHPKRVWQIPFTLHNIHSPLIVCDPKYLSQQLWTPLHTATTLSGIMMPDLGPTAREANTFWDYDIISSNNLRPFLPWAMMIDQVFLPIITLLGVL